MRIRIGAIAAITGLLVSACVNHVPEQQATAATAEMRDRSGAALGSAILGARANSLVLQLDLKGMEPGMRAIHLHTKGDCSSPDFTSAGGHLNPAGVAHGRDNPAGAHLGDLPNIEVTADGRVSTSVRISEDSNLTRSAILDEDGTAVVIHAGPDDYVSDPSGAAGPRIACGILKSR